MNLIYMIHMEFTTILNMYKLSDAILYRSRDLEMLKMEKIKRGKTPSSSILQLRFAFFKTLLEVIDGTLEAIAYT